MKDLLRLRLKEVAQQRETYEAKDVYYNEQNGTVAYALIEQNERIYGADNAGAQWHVHPFEHPNHHVRLSGPMEFSTFLAAVEQRY